MARYSRDPYWLNARFASDCAKCGKRINKGDRIFYYPITKSPMGSACGCAEDAAADFSACAFDEAFVNGGW